MTPIAGRSKLRLDSRNTGEAIEVRVPAIDRVDPARLHLGHAKGVGKVSVVLDEEVEGTLEEILVVES